MGNTLSKRDVASCSLEKKKALSVFFLFTRRGPELHC